MSISLHKTAPPDFRSEVRRSSFRFATPRLDGQRWFSYWLQAVHRISKQHFNLPTFRPNPWEVSVIRNMAPINLIVYHPKTAEGRNLLAKRVSDAHASAVIQRIKSLNCPTSQKLALLDAVIKTAKERSKEQT